MIKPITQEAGDLIREFEGFSAKPYLDQKGIPTIGIGTIAYPNGKKVTMKDSPITLKQAEEYLFFELTEKADIVYNFLKKSSVILGDQQYSALVSFAYNCGCGPITDSGRSLYQAIKSKNITAIADSFLLYNKIKKKVLFIEKTIVSTGLTRRRKSERFLFLNGKNNFFESEAA